MEDKKPKSGMALMIGMGKPDADEKMPDTPDEPEDQGEDKNYSITPPDGFEPPDDVQGSDQFDATIRCHMEDGMIVIDSINGIKTKEGDESEGQETDPDTSPPQQSLDQAMEAQKSYRG